VRSSRDRNTARYSSVAPEAGGDLLDQQLLVSTDRLEVLGKAFHGGLEHFALGAPLDSGDHGLRGEDAMLEVIEARPCLALPCAVFGPVDLEALRRFAPALR